MKQKEVAKNYKNGVLWSAIFTFSALLLAVIFPNILEFLLGGKSTRLFGFLLILGGIYSFFKKESYSLKPSLKNGSFVSLFPASVFALPDSAFRRHTGWKFQIWSLIVVVIGIFLAL